MFSNNIQILFLSMLLLINVSEEQNIPNRFCERGHLDSGVRTQNGAIFVFFDYYYLELNQDLNVVNRNPIPFQNYFRNLNFDRIDTAFTADGENNPNRGKTYFIRNKVIKEYINDRPTGLESRTDLWKSNYPLASVDLVINQIDDILALFLDLDQSMSPNLPFRLYFFDSVEEPTIVYATKWLNIIALITDPMARGNILKAVIPLVNNSYLVFYNPIDLRMEGMFCLTDRLDSGCGSQGLRQSRSLCLTSNIPTTTTTTRRTTTTRYRPPQPPTRPPTTRPPTTRPPTTRPPTTRPPSNNTTGKKSTRKKSTRTRKKRTRKKTTPTSPPPTRQLTTSLPPTSPPPTSLPPTSPAPTRPPTTSQLTTSPFPIRPQTESPPQTSSGGFSGFLFVVLLVIMLLIIGVILWSIFFFVSKNRKRKEENETKERVKT